jgi:glucan biosynthesis protein
MSIPERDSATNTKMIVVNWQPITAPENGNSVALSYSLEYDAGTNRETWEALTGYLADSLELTMQVTA